LGAVASAAGLAFAVGAAGRFAAAVPPGDPRRYFVPLLTGLGLVILTDDLDNLVYTALRNALVPGIVLWLSMRRARTMSPPP
jgi:hypothetical protein